MSKLFYIFFSLLATRRLNRLNAAVQLKKPHNCWQISGAVILIRLIKSFSIWIFFVLRLNFLKMTWASSFSAIYESSLALRVVRYYLKVSVDWIYSIDSKKLYSLNFEYHPIAIEPNNYRALWSPPISPANMSKS